MCTCNTGYSARISTQTLSVFEINSSRRVTLYLQLESIALRKMTVCNYFGYCSTECTKIAHRCSLAIFTADEGIAGNSAARIAFTRFHRRRNRGSLAIFFAEEIAHLGASKSRVIFPGAVKIATAAAENRAILVHSAAVRFSP